MPTITVRLTPSEFRLLQDLQQFKGLRTHSEAIRQLITGTVSPPPLRPGALAKLQANAPRRRRRYT